MPLITDACITAAGSATAGLAAHKMRNTTCTSKFRETEIFQASMKQEEEAVSYMRFKHPGFTWGSKTVCGRQINVPNGLEIKSSNVESEASKAKAADNNETAPSLSQVFKVAVTAGRILKHERNDVSFSPVGRAAFLGIKGFCDGPLAIITHGKSLVFPTSYIYAVTNGSLTSLGRMYETDRYQPHCSTTARLHEKGERYRAFLRHARYDQKELDLYPMQLLVQTESDMKKHASKLRAKYIQESLTSKELKDQFKQLLSLLSPDASVTSVNQNPYISAMGSKSKIQALKAISSMDKSFLKELYSDSEVQPNFTEIRSKAMSVALKMKQERAEEKNQLIQATIQSIQKNEAGILDHAEEFRNEILRIEKEIYGKVSSEEEEQPFFASNSHMKAFRESASRVIESVTNQVKLSHFKKEEIYDMALLEFKEIINGAKPFSPSKHYSGLPFYVDPSEVQAIEKAHEARATFRSQNQSPAKEFRQFVESSFMMRALNNEAIGTSCKLS